LRSIIIIITALILSIVGCDDAGIVRSGKTVSGKLVDESGFPVGGVRVKIGDNETQSGSDGSFVLNEITYPYNLKVLMLGSPNRAYYYENLNLTQPIVTLFGTEGSHYNADITVTIPPMSGQERAYVIFSDLNKVQSDAVIVQPNTSVNFTVRWKGNEQLSGKVMVLVVNYISGAVINYEKYGEKSVSITANSSNTVSFYAPDLSFNPGEINVSGNLIIPAGALSPRIDLQLNFKQGGSLISPFTSGTTVSYINGTNFSLILPADISPMPRFVFGGSALGSNIYEFTTGTLVYSQPVTVVSIDLNSFPVLISPAHSASDVTYSTLFRISLSGGNFAFVYTFDGNDRVFYLVTMSTEVRIPDFRDMGFGIASSHSYEWWVSGYGNITSTDEFLGYDIHSNNSLKKYISSTQRSFSTSP
jgi:hypothetical protein